MTKKIAVVIVAAGSGTRFGDEVPKQYHKLGNKTLLRHCIDVFSSITDPGLIQVVYNPAHKSLYADATANWTHQTSLCLPVSGGGSRQESVFYGLSALKDKKPDVVLIHDAARPGIDLQVIHRVLDGLDIAKGVVPSLPVADTIKQVSQDSQQISKTIPRDILKRAQTPQGFDFKTIMMLHEKFRHQEFTDDAALLEAEVLPVICVDGSAQNDKITLKTDLTRQETQFLENKSLMKDTIQMQREEFRCGTGFDVHRFEDGDHCMLCGIAVPHNAGLAGHSDADVGLHALTDALLGAIGAGDIGIHFPPSDMKWKGAQSDQFAAYAAKMVRDRGGRIVNADITLICERPKIGPHTAVMRERVASILGIETDRVNVKATTSERLGFTGREEGIAAQAAVSVALPLA